MVVKPPSCVNCASCRTFVCFSQAKSGNRREAVVGRLRIFVKPSSRTLPPPEEEPRSSLSSTEVLQPTELSISPYGSSFRLTKPSYLLLMTGADNALQELNHTVSTLRVSVTALFRFGLPSVKRSAEEPLYYWD